MPRLERSCGVIPLKETSSGMHVLLVRHAAGDYWSFPKGHIEEGEDPIDTAARELKEETGLEIDELLSEETLSEKYTFVRDSQEIEKTVVYYVAKVSGAIETNAPDVLEAKWFSLTAAAQMITYDDSKALLAKVHHLIDRECE